MSFMPRFCAYLALVLLFQGRAFADDAAAAPAASTAPSPAPAQPYITASGDFKQTVPPGDWKSYKWIYISSLPLDDPNGPVAAGKSRGLSPSQTEATRALSWYATKPSKSDEPNFREPIQHQQDDYYAVGPLYPYEPNREFWTAQTQIAIGYISAPGANGCDPKSAPKIEFKEDPRQSAFMQGVKSLIGGETGKAKMLSGDGQTVYCLYANVYALGQERGTLGITVTPPDSAGGANQKATATVLTGSAETFFFTADVPVTNPKELQYDPKTKTVTEKDKPNNIMVGLNALWGDPYKSYDWWDHHRLAIKLFADPTTPKKAFGLGFGYVIKTGALDPTTENVGGLMAFVGYERTQGSTGINSYGWIFGVSYNLNAFSSGK